MQRITTTVDRRVYARLQDLARRDDVPVARLIREAMERYVVERETEMQPEPLPDWVGMIEGPGGDYASRDEEVLKSEWAAELERRPRSESG